MRIKTSTSFPYPVLSTHTGDYDDRTFSINLEIEEEPHVGAVFLRGSATIDDPSINDFIQTGVAKFGLMIHCQDTYLDQFVECPLEEIKLDMSGGRVRGTVHVRGVVISTQENLSLGSTHIVDEFPPDVRFAQEGSFIALTTELTFEAGLEKLAPLESIFRLKKSEDTPEGQFRLGLDSESVEIHAHPDLYNVIHNLREQASLRDLLIPSIYLPVVMSALDAMREDDFIEKRWHIIMSARCNAEGIDVKNIDDLAAVAQNLLASPMKVLKTVAERVN